MILSNDNRYKGSVGASLRLDEKRHVEEPFLEQLHGLNWTILRLTKEQLPKDSYRSDFKEVVLKPELRKALKAINSFLTESQLDEVITKITTFDGSNLIENNKKVLELLLKNTTVGKNEVTGEPSPTVKYIDFETLTNNSFIAISQFKIRIPGTEHHIIPDIVLFVNGLPLSVIECKSPKVKEPIAEAIDQLMRYSEQRGEMNEGSRELFYYNQTLVTTCRQIAKFGTITTHNERLFFRWTDPYPYSLSDLPHEGTSPNDQQRLVAGMLDRKNLLDLLRTYTIITVDDEGKTIKVVARYQQFRAVKYAVKRLLEGKNSRERGGIIWHTQGSGKSLTMMFMVREMRRHLSLFSWKIIFVTDRTQLEEQLTTTSQGVGFTVHPADSITRLKELIATKTPDLIMAMIQKFQDRDFSDIFPELNESPNVLIMTDEAHRTQYQLLGANLRRAIPNATHIAYTGTPIDLTEQHFGDYIDKYTMRQSNDDGVTLRIVYEGRTHNAEVTDAPKMDQRFQDVFSEYSIQERLQILGYGSRDAYLEAKETIKAKADDMLNHYIRFVFPNGFKAQVVATSREAAIRYKEAMAEILPLKIAELEKENPYSIDINQLKKLEIAVVISGDHNDTPRYKLYTDSTEHKKDTARFKMRFGKEKEGLTGNVGIIVVNNMLLTGFDAPIEQVMYLDRVIIEHNLLQAIARVNRIGPEGKEVGFVIDYVGVGHHLKRALEHYDEREQKEITDNIFNPSVLVSELIDAHRNIWEFLKKHNCTDFNDPDTFFDLFYDEDIRFEYLELFRKLTSAFNNTLPQKEALDYIDDYKSFAEINELAARHLHDARISMKGVPAKLRAITDEFLASKGINQKVAPISILDSEFQKNVKARKKTRTQAAEIEHAIRHYIETNADDDPELFASFSKMLEEILEAFRGNWERIREELEKLREKIRDKEKEETYGLNRKTHMPFFRVLRQELWGENQPDEQGISQLVNLTQQALNLIQVELSSVGFWDAIPAQMKLKAELQKLLLSEQFISLPGIRTKYSEIISRMMEIARSKNDVIIK